MKKILLSVLLLICFTINYSNAQNEDAAISADQIEYWIGEGDNEVIFAVNWCSPETALAWGYRFSTESVIVSDLMNDIAAADSRFSFDGGGTINNIYYNDDEYSLSLSGSYFMYNINGALAGLGYESQEVVNGDLIKWGDDACAIVDWENWSYTWTTVIQPVSNPNPVVIVDAAISADQIEYWIGEGDNEVIFAVNWCSPEAALAWGYRFSADSILVSDMMNNISAADSRFAYVGGNGFVSDITYNDENHNLSLTAGSYFMYNVNGLGAMVGYDANYVVDGDLVKFGDAACGTADPNWNYTWTTEIQPVSTPDTVQDLFDGMVGDEDCQAIFCQNPAILGWAATCNITRGLQDITTPDLWASYGTEADAVGAATESTMDVVSLGDSGIAVLTFDQPITNGNGYDFAVFENALNDTFLELSFVEVSSDGVNYVRFPAISNTPTDEQITNSGSINARNINNLAGKHRVGWGTPFDLDELAGNDLVDINNITHIKLIDVIGTIDPSHASRDSRNQIINDPYPTNFNSCGFDLDGVAILNGWLPNDIQEYTTHANATMSVFPNPCHSAVTCQAVTGELVTLYNMQGSVVYSQIADNDNVTINTQLLPDGVYFVKCANQTAKIIKQ